jgi:hypothetical protein
MRVIVDYRLTDAAAFDPFFLRVHRMLEQATLAGEIDALPTIEYVEWDFPRDEKDAPA